MKNCRRTNQRNYVIISSRSCTRYGIFLLLFSKSANKFLKCVFNAETKHLSGFYDSSLIQGRVKTVERLKTKSDLINFVLFFPYGLQRVKTPIPCAALIRNRQYYSPPIQTSCKYWVGQDPVLFSPLRTVTIPFSSSPICITICRTKEKLATMNILRILYSKFYCVPDPVVI